MLRVVQQVSETAPANAFAADCLPRIAPPGGKSLLIVAAAHLRESTGQFDGRALSRQRHRARARYSSPGGA